jgi:DNA-binding helix-hairpin-helix protein with protein kinase domain
MYANAGGQVVGFIMPRFASHEPIHHLYNPAQRIKYFPRANWAFLLHAARNCAAAFEEVHRADCLVGDVNQSNLLVSAEATVGLIDCDSFQVRSNGSVYLCEVGVPIYSAPELQGRAYRGLVRSANHDRFGLALLVFQLLFMGRHPYAGRFLGRGDVSLEQAIAEYRFAYGRSAPSMQMERPPHTLALSDVSGELSRLFERAFTRGSEIENARPTATEWRCELDAARRQLRVCEKDGGHVYLTSREQCPWCVIASAGGPNHFRTALQPASVFAPDLARLAELWSRIQAVSLPTFDAQQITVPETTPVPSPLPETVPFHVFYGRLLGAIVLLGLILVLSSVLWGPLAAFGGLLILVFFPWYLYHTLNSPLERERRGRQSALAQAARDFDAVGQQWKSIVSTYVACTQSTLKQLESARRQCTELGASYVSEREQLEANKESLALDQFLKTQFIVDFDIPMIGAGRKLVLASYGLETAYDMNVDAIQSVTGFGEVLTRNLMEWKRQRREAFRFDPKSGVPVEELRSLVAKFQQEQKSLFARLEQGADELRLLVAQTERQVKALKPEFHRRAAARSQARANLEVFR